jgi:hypothetical protein
MSLFTANPAAAATPTAHLRRQLIEELRFARDSSLEGSGFELPVPASSCDP